MVIFKDNQDYRVFISRLKENLYPNLKVNPLDGAHRGRSHTPYIRKLLPEGAFLLIAYCLMPNHFHLLLKQNSRIPLSKLILKVCGSYSKYFNKKYNRVGSLFQDQFKTERVDNNEYLLWLSAYIHLNPRVANLVRDDLKWEWSSYKEYLDISANTLCDRKIISDQFSNPKMYQKIVNDAFSPIKSKKYPLLEILNVEFESP